MDTELEELDAQLEEFGKDALIKHVLAELELMRAMIELVRVEIRGMQPWPNTIGGVPNQINYPSSWPPGTVYCGTKTSSGTGQLNGPVGSTSVNVNSVAYNDFADHNAFTDHLDEIIADSVKRVNESRAEMDEILGTLEA
jgi:hypothetical protein